jgi:hypothetical protein
MFVKLKFLNGDFWRALFKLTSVCGLFCAVASCASMPTGAVNGYPNLRDVPENPQNVITTSQWNSELGQLGQANQELKSQPFSHPLTATETDVSWANQTRDSLVSDPKSAPAPTNDDALAWAAQTREKLEAELKTNPH